MTPKPVRYLTAALLLWCTLLGTMAVAQPAPAPPQSQDGIRYIQGGIGSDEVAAIRAQASQYNLRLTFANTHGEYLSDIAVHIVSASAATVVALKAEGPLLYMKVPPGRYRISAGTRRNFERRWVTVPPQGALDAVFTWHDRQHPGNHGPQTSCDGNVCNLPSPAQ